MNPTNLQQIRALIAARKRWDLIFGIVGLLALIRAVACHRQHDEQRRAEEDSDAYAQAFELHEHPGARVYLATIV